MLIQLCMQVVVIWRIFLDLLHNRMGEEIETPMSTNLHITNLHYILFIFLQNECVHKMK